MTASGIAMVAVMVILALLAGRRRPHGSRSPRRSPGPRRAPRSSRPRHPQPGEIWFVSFPYSEDRTAAKDRPVLVVSAGGRTARVRKITSQDQSRRPHEYDRLPREVSGLIKDSWIRKAEERIPVEKFRRRAGVISAPR